MSEPESLQQVRRTYVRHRGRELSFFAGCDYFRLASHPAVLKATVSGLKKFGLNVAASRLTTGNHELYKTVEKQLAEFFDAEAALLVSSGYVTNLIVAQALAGSFSHALIDEKAHMSPADAAQYLNCPILKFKHQDVADLKAALARCGEGARPIVLTDGLYAGDGTVAPLKAYLKLLPRDGLILVDDAHGAGTVGANGRGSLEVAGVSRQRVIQCVTLSKGFGCYGGAILGAKSLRTRVMANSRMFIGSTPPPLPLIHAASTAIRLVAETPAMRTRLKSNADFLKDTLRNAGLKLAQTPGPILRIVLPTAALNERLRQALLAAGIHPPFLKYPGSPAGGNFRFVISSEHSKAQLTKLASVLKPFVPQAQS